VQLAEDDADLRLDVGFVGEGPGVLLVGLYLFSEVKGVFTSRYGAPAGQQSVSLHRQA
jgi:hypothetical protein